MSVHIPSDTIHFNSISTGGNSAGNGGAGVNVGNITDNAHIDFKPSNYASGADVDVHNGDHITQNTHGGTADSSHGPDTSMVHADTTAYQSNFLAADMSQSVVAGIGGNGCNDNYAVGGDVHVHA